MTSTNPTLMAIDTEKVLAEAAIAAPVSYGRTPANERRFADAPALAERYTP